jgi:lysophospholipase L1-like esterase
MVAFAVVTVTVSTAVLVALAEILLRFLQPTSDLYLALTPGTRVVFDPRYQPGVEGPALYQVNSMGARAREWSDDRSSEYRVLAMGGSTTECLMNDQERAWPAVLERELGTREGRSVWVGNIGRSGLSSRHHLLQAERLLATYDPDMVVLLVGVNDLAGRLRGGARDDDADLAMAFQVTPGETSGVRWKNDPWFKRTRVWGALRALKYNWLNRALEQDREGKATESWREMRRRGRRTSELPDLESALEEYRGNLTRIVELVRRRGAEPILMTQPTLWRTDLTEAEERLLWMGGVGDFRTEPGAVYYTADALAQGMDLYNRALLQVCRELSARCFDAASILPKTTAMFFDDCHFTDEGNLFLGRAVASFLRSSARGVDEGRGAASSEEHRDSLDRDHEKDRR